MGVARLSCAGGCACPAHDIDAHQPEGEQGRRVSVFQEHAFEAAVVAEPACELLLVLQNRTSSLGHKFKMRGVKAVWERKAGAESEEGADSADDAGPPGGHTAGGAREGRRTGTTHRRGCDCCGSFESRAGCGLLCVHSKQKEGAYVK